MIANFQIEDKISRPRFFQKIYLVANTKFEVILGMFFLIISHVNMSFSKKSIIWKSYTLNKALTITKQIQIVDPKEFVIAAMDADSKTFIMYVAI